MLNEHTRKSIRASLPRPLRIFFAVFLLYTAVTWISCAIHYRLGHSQAYSSPFIHQSWDPFTDFRTYYIRFGRYFHKQEFFNQYPDRDLPYFSYPAPGAAVYSFFYSFHRPTRVYLGIGMLWAALLVYGLFRVLERMGVRRSLAAGLSLLMWALAFPFDFMLERGNIELVVWILVFVGIFLYLRRHDNASAVVLGIAASTKIFPIIFCGILLHRRRYAALILSVLTAVVCDLLALWYAGPTFWAAFHGFNNTVSNYQQSYSVPARAADVGMDHSFFALTKVVGQQFGLHYQTWLHPYYVVAGMLALVLFFGRSLRLPLANQLLFIMIMAVGLPPNSFDYTFVYLYAPWIVVCVVAFTSWQRNRVMPWLAALLLCFVPLFAPFSLFVRHDVRFGGHIQTVFLLLLLYLCLRYPIPDELWSGAGIARLGDDQRMERESVVGTGRYPLPEGVRASVR